MTVDCAVEEAFRIFTTDTIELVAARERTRSIAERVTEIVFEQRVGGEVYEVRAGERGHWATVLEWDPPSRLVLGWNILGGRRRNGARDSLLSRE